MTTCASSQIIHRKSGSSSVDYPLTASPSSQYGVRLALKHNLEHKTELALSWITEQLKRNNIDYVLTGGLAAFLYGSKRKPHDIDILLTHDTVREICQKLNEWVVEKPDFYNDGTFSVYAASLYFHGQRIELLGGTKAKSITGEWKDFGDFAQTSKDITLFPFGNSFLPLMNKKELIEKKKFTAREKDIEDIENIILSTYGVNK
jgi:hypothetical protein